MVRLWLAVLLFGCALPERTYGAVPDRQVVVHVEGTFTPDPRRIAFNGSPGAFPLPELLGGSFEGQFSLPLNITGPENLLFREFKIADIRIDVFDKFGGVVHTIVEAPNDFRVYNGRALALLGPSGRGQPGHIPNKPTDIRFELMNEAFLKANFTPPESDLFNGATILWDPDSSVFDVPAFVEIDASVDPFSGWDLPISSLTLQARDVPEPHAAIIVGSCLVFWRKFRREF